MNVALIGAGRMGRRHMQAVREAGFRLVAVADRSRESLEVSRDELKLPEEALFTDAGALLATVRPTCVVVATTADSHCELVCAAAEAGAEFVLVEKPMAVSLDQCDRMLEVCRRSGTRLAVNHQMRFMPQYTVPKALLSTEMFGPFASMTVVAGNFGFAMNGSHFFEAFRHIAGEPIAEVDAWFSPEVVPNPRGPQFQDRGGTIRAVTASGKRLILEIGTDQGYGLFVTYASRYGAITVNEISGQLVAFAREEEYRSLPTTRIALPAERIERSVTCPSVVEITAAVLRALVDDVDSVSGENGRLAIQALVAAHQSAETGKRVKVDDQFDRSRMFPWA